MKTIVTKPYVCTYPIAATIQTTIILYCQEYLIFMLSSFKVY